MLEVGQSAPDIALQDAGGKTVHLSQFHGKKAVVLYFYPKDNTPGCTAQACAFRDAYEDFKAVGAEVIGISSDSEASHEDFAAQNQLPFLLLSDPDGQARQAFGVPKTLGLLPGRVTFVIDRAGIIRYTFNSQLRATTHVEKALDILRHGSDQAGDAS